MGMDTIQNIEVLDVQQRIEQKQQQRNQDMRDIQEHRISRLELQQKNSIFTGIDWSVVEIFEPTGYHWKVT